MIVTSIFFLIHLLIYDILDKRSKLKYIVICTLLILILPLTYLYIIVHKDNYLYDDINELDYILVLGCRVNEDGSGSTSLNSRLDKAIEIARESDIKIIVSGGQGSDEPISEAQYMYNYLIENEIDSSRIILEDKSTSTLENIKYSSKYINNNEKGVIITNDFHIFRTHMIANRFKLNTYLEPVKVPFSNSNLREVLALYKSIIFDRNN